MDADKSSSHGDTEKPSANSWIFVGDIKDIGVRYFEGSSVGDIVGWRHGNDAYTLAMQPGDIALIYVTNGKERQIRGLGIVLAVREPFVLDTRTFSDADAPVQRIPILITDLFEDHPIAIADLELGEDQRLVKGQGSVHPVEPSTNASLVKTLEGRGLSGKVLNLEFKEKAKLVAASNIWEYLETSDYLALFDDYISVDKRKKMVVGGVRPKGNMSIPDFVQKIEEVWSVKAPPEITGLDPVLDNPSSVQEDDKLDRYPMADILARRLRSVFRNAQDRWPPAKGGVLAFLGIEKYSGEDVDAAPFTLLVDSPWGGGKTSFANFLMNILSKEDPESADERLKAKGHGWTVVTFNAWRHQHVKPVWWVLYGYIVTALLKRRYDKKGKASAVRMWVSQKSWQLATWQNVVACSAWLLTCLLAIWFYSSGLMDSHSKTLTPGSALGVIGLVALGGLPIFVSLRGLIIGVMNSLNPGRASANANFSLGLKDPLERFRIHFRRTLAREREPVLLVIDDLDRCQASFVVELVQGLQTLLRSQHLFVLLLGDRSWIENCFDVEFQSMDPERAINGKGQLGRRYVEKALQMSLTLPVASESQRFALLDSATYVRSRPTESGDGSTAVSTGDIDPKTEKSTEQDTSPTPNEGAEGSTPSSGYETQTRTKTDWKTAQQIVVSPETDADIRKTVLKFADFFPNNPRQIKRIVNTISFYQAVAIGLGVIPPRNEDLEKFYIWIIAYLEFNEQWTQLSKKPSLLRTMREDQTFADFDDNFKSLMNLDHGQSTFDGAESTEISEADVIKFSTIIPAVDY